MRYYELMMVVAANADEERMSAALDRVNHYVNEQGGNIILQERWGNQRRLAYPIKNNTEGSYVLTHMEIDPQATKDLEANLLLSEDILRHLLVRIDSIPAIKEVSEASTDEVSEASTDEVSEASTDAVDTLNNEEILEGKEEDTQENSGILDEPVDVVEDIVADAKDELVDAQENIIKNTDDEEESA